MCKKQSLAFVIYKLEMFLGEIQFESLDSWSFFEREAT